MDELIGQLDANLKVDNLKVNHQTIEFWIHSKASEAQCPKCHQYSHKIHGHYSHTIQDLPIQGKTVYLHIDVKRFQCTNPQCSVKTFGEQFEFSEPKAQKTKRLVDTIVDLSLDKSSLTAVYDFHQIGIKVKKSSLCNYQKKIPVIDYHGHYHVCVDDFALKKRYRYASILVDIDTGKIIDILESRDSTDVSQWLGAFKNINLFSRDGSLTYSTTITAAFPTVEQVSDRYHLIARLIDLAQGIVYHQIPAKVPVFISDKEYQKFEDFLLYATRRNKILYVRDLYYHQRMTQTEIRMKTGFSIKLIKKYVTMLDSEIPADKMLAREKIHDDNTKQKQKQINYVRQLRTQGKSLADIEGITNYTQARIKRYLDPHTTANKATYGADIPGKLRPYRQQVLELRKQGKSYALIHQQITKDGYTGTVDAIRGFMARQRRLQKQLDSKYIGKSIEIIERRWIIKLLFFPLQEVPVITKKLLDQLFTEYPIYRKIYDLVWDF